MAKIITRTFAYLSFALLMYVVFLLVSMPASWVWKMVEPHARPALVGVEVSQVSGTIWDGKLQVQYQRLPVSIGWSFEFKPLLTGKLGLVLDARSGDAEVSLRALVNQEILAVDRLDGKLDLAQLNPWLKRDRLELAGLVNLSDFDAKVSREGKIMHAQGQLSWQGGVVKYPAGRAIHTREMSGLNGTIVTEDDRILLNVVDQEQFKTVLDIVLDAAGWANVEVKKRLLDLADEPWKKGVDDQTTVFKIKKKIY